MVRRSLRLQVDTMDLTALIASTRKHIVAAEFKDALKLLKQYPQFHKEVPVLQLYGEIYLEQGKVDRAFDKFSKAVEMDSEGVHGAEKFLYLGQIIGGEAGLQLIDRGIVILSQTQDVKKINQSIFAQIEIWMTDLCMSPTAEAKCDELISQSLSLDQENPETWSLLANIRISQQRDEDATQAIEKSWELFHAKKEALEQEGGMNDEYLDLVQPLLSLSKMCLELGLYELSMEILTNVKDIDETNAEVFYLEGFTNYLYIKKSQYFQAHESFDVDSFEQFVVKSLVGFEENATLAKLAFEQVLKLSQVDDNIDPDILMQTQELLQQLEIDVQVEDDAINEDNWVDAIEE